MTAIPRAVETRSLTGFQALEQAGWPIPCCRACGVQLNVVPQGDDHDGYHVEDVVNVGARKKVGSAYVCHTCGFDEAKQAARLRRVATIRHRGDYVD